MRKIDRKGLGMALLLAAGVMLMLALTMASAMKAEEDRGADMQEAVLNDVPDAEASALTASKSEAYGGTGSPAPRMDDYWESCEDIYGTPRKEDRRTAEDLFGAGTDEVREARQEEPASNPYRETPEEREERHRKRREEAIDMAVQMTENSRAAEEPVPADASETAASTDTTVHLVPKSCPVRRTGIISSLDDMTAGDGISTLGTEEYIEEEGTGRPIRCMFAKESKLRSGQRVPIILMEDIIASGTLIPKNTHIMANCRIGERMELELASIEIGGMIVHLGYEAYDIDGGKGIYCPDAGKAGRTIRRRGREVAGSSLSSMVRGIAKDVVNTSVQLMQSSDGEVTVTVPAGYTFFIVKKKSNF